MRFPWMISRAVHSGAKKARRPKASERPITILRVGWPMACPGEGPRGGLLRVAGAPRPSRGVAPPRVLVVSNSRSRFCFFSVFSARFPMIPEGGGWCGWGLGAGPAWDAPTKLDRRNSAPTGGGGTVRDSTGRRCRREGRPGTKSNQGARPPPDVQGRAEGGPAGPLHGRGLGSAYTQIIKKTLRRPAKPPLITDARS